MTVSVLVERDIDLTGSRAAIETLVRLMEDAFEGDPKHSTPRQPPRSP